MVNTIKVLALELVLLLGILFMTEPVPYLVALRLAAMQNAAAK